MSDTQIPELTEETKKRFDMAISILEEVAQELQLEDISNYVEKDCSGFNCYYYKMEDGKVYQIFIEFGYEFGTVRLYFPLGHITNNIILHLEKLLSDERAPEVLSNSVVYELSKRKINMLTLFNAEESEVTDIIKGNSKEILKYFIQNLPLIGRASVVDALIHSFAGYLQHIIKPKLKEHWHDLGLPKDFNLLTETELNDVHKHNLDVKRWFTGDKRQLLNSNTIKVLYKEADDLRKEYSAAKRRYKELKISFELLNRKATREDWLKKWKEIQIEDFPTLDHDALETIEYTAPFELATIHLASTYGYDLETIKKKITQSRKMSRQKNG